MANDLLESRHVVLSGCSGGGKSALLSELARRGFPTVPEPGRRIVEAEMRGDGSALPWVDLAAFARRAIAMAGADRRVPEPATGWVFFDRGLVDAAVALEHATGHPAAAILEQSRRYHRQVFMTPPWPEIFVTDSERRHRLEDAVTEYHRLAAAYGEFGYETILLPKVGVGERAEFVLQHLR
jgi:predicted ATPase